MNSQVKHVLYRVLLSIILILCLQIKTTLSANDDGYKAGTPLASIDKVVAQKYGLTMQQWNRMKQNYDENKDGHLSKDEATKLIDHLEEKAGRGKGSGIDTTSLLYGGCAILVVYVAFLWYKNNQGRYGQGGYRLGTGQTLGSAPRGRDRYTPLEDESAMIPPPNARQRKVNKKIKPVAASSKAANFQEEFVPEYEPPPAMKHNEKYRGQTLVDKTLFEEPKTKDDTETAEPSLASLITKPRKEAASSETANSEFDPPASAVSRKSVCEKVPPSVTDSSPENVTEPNAPSRKPGSDSERKGPATSTAASQSDRKPPPKNKDNRRTDTQMTPPSPKIETFEETLCRVLSASLNINVKISESKGKKETWTMATIQLKKSDIPSTEKEVPLKTKLFFERRLAREVYGSSKIKFAVMCYENTATLIQAEEKPDCASLVLAILRRIKDLCIVSIIDNLMNEQTSFDDDDLFAGIEANPQAILQSGLVNFLHRLSGWADDGAIISPELLSKFLIIASASDKGVKAIADIIRVGGESLLQVVNSNSEQPKGGPRIKPRQRLDDMERDHGSTLRGLEILLAHPAMADIVAKTLEAELSSSDNSLGIYFEEKSILGNLLSISSIPVSSNEIRNPNHPNNQAWLTMKNFPKMQRDDLTRLEGSILSGIKRVQNIVFKLLKSLAKKHREEVMAWLSSAVSMNEMRTTANFNNQAQGIDEVKTSCSDGFAVNLCCVMIDLCLPFCQQGNRDKLLKISSTYCTSKACRLNYHFETCLAGGQIVSDDETSHIHGLLPLDLRDNFNFMTEIFHVTARALHIGFFTALKKFIKDINSWNQALASTDDSDPKKETMKMLHMLLSLRWDCCLLDPELLRKASQFYITVAQWISLQLEAPEIKDEKALIKHQKKTMSHIPEFIVKDMTRWFWFLAEHGLRVHKDAIAGLDLVPFVECCVTLLQRPDLVPGPIPAYRITQALNSFVRSATNDSTIRGAGWGGMISSPLASIVHTNPAVTTHLGPALLHTYVSVAVVEGLDVDKEDFDKYAARADIGDLIENLWERQDFRASILKLCGEDVVQQFLGAILDTLLYQLHDSWARLANVRKLEQAKEDEAAWNRLSFSEKQEKEKFLSNEEVVAKGFMRMARKSLGLLDCVTGSDKVASCFTQGSLAQRAASAFLGFIDKLCGSKAIDLKVKDMDKYNFSPMNLLAQILDIMLRIVREEQSRETGFVVSLSLDDDYNEVSMAKALTVVQTKGIGGAHTEEELADLIAEIGLMRSERPADDEADTDQGWMTEVEAMECDESALETEYIEQMEDFRFDTTDLIEYHSFQSNAESQPVDPGSQKAKSLMKEIKQWSTSLPIHPRASVFLRQDEERMDVVRALVTGPVDTPYSLGCFAFDIYFPANYPNIPPLVKLITTGNGTVRFNPNLYADGKVCLSLLGTWHGGDASQKWQSGKSSLYQVLVSIQSMILITDPMYNEPGYDGMRGTEEGETRSRQYNSTIRLWTARHAMLGQLLHPPVGFEDIVVEHFKLQKTAILKQCVQWLKECVDKDEYRKLHRVVEELRDALYKL